MGSIPEKHCRFKTICCTNLLNSEGQLNFQLNCTHHNPGVLPLGEFVEDPEQVDAGEHVSPAVH